MPIAETARYRIADDIVAQPLVNCWTAWWGLVAPLPGSFTVARSQIPLMVSFIEDPDGHAMAVADPSLQGGSFMGTPVQRVEEVRNLLNKTRVEFADAIDFAQALSQFGKRMVDEPKGASLVPYYAKLPECLKGYVELVYDYYNRASVRVDEGLLYRSAYYKEDLQSFRIWRLRSDKDRVSFVTTPRLPEESELDWHIRFSDARVDAFFSLDVEPKPWGHIREI